MFDSPMEAARQAKEIIAGWTPTPPQPMLIGIGGSGYAAGKDTVADQIAKDHGFTKMGMSDALHEFLLRQNPIIGLLGDVEYTTEWGLPTDMLHYRDHAEQVGYVKAKEHPEFRRIMQTTGTDAARHVLGEETWTDAAARKVAQIRSGGSPVAITGIRYPNEVEMIRRLGGVSLYVDRPMPEGVEALTHSSETSVGPQDFDIVLPNDGTLEQLAVRTQLIMGRLGHTQQT